MNSDTQKSNGIILKGIGGFYYVKTADGVFESKPKGIFRLRGIKPIAGDMVSLEKYGEEYVIAEISERRNAFIRPPVANVDNMLLVVSTVDPKPNILVLDKLLAIACRKAIKPVIALTKTDIAQSVEFARLYKNAGFEVIDIKADLENASRAIETICSGKLTVLSGNSGVGKSTLLNALCKNLLLETGEISKKLGRGKHTTRAVELYEYCGGYIADTPGFSDVDFEGAEHFEKEELCAAFPDIEKYAKGCYFTGCSHTVEKGCEVLNALRDGKIEKSRHESYVAMYRQASEQSKY
ncbi:MAG: ribosome small subunit-dependent GTPase A [Oscillospiraceae bacterium]